MNAARVSYNTEKVADEKDQKLAKFLWNHNHSSPFRHAFYTFKIKAPLCVMRQWWKHQVGAPWVTVETEDGQSVNIDISAMFIDSDGSPSWNELSGRYVEFSDEFYIPKLRSTLLMETNKSQTLSSPGQTSSTPKLVCISRKPPLTRSETTRKPSKWATAVNWLVCFYPKTSTRQLFGRRRYKL